MQQYALSLNLPHSFSAESFFVSSCNADAYRWITAWPNWPGNTLLVSGPPGAGKTHLGHIWQAKSHAIWLEAATLDPAALPEGAIILEAIEQIPRQESLLHLYNSCRENNQPLLLTSLYPPAQLPFTLPDLTSRLLALPCAILHAPDDTHLAAALRKQFADRQLKVEEEVVAYLVTRMERSLKQAQLLVEALDAHAISEKKAVTVPFVKRVLNL